jgi:hypothetical protein
MTIYTLYSAPIVSNKQAGYLEKPQPICRMTCTYCAVTTVNNSKDCQENKVRMQNEWLN